MVPGIEPSADAHSVAAGTQSLTASGNFTVPYYTSYLDITLWGGGAGAGSAGPSATSATAGRDTTIVALGLTANGGNIGGRGTTIDGGSPTGGSGGSGGTGVGGTTNSTGGAGSAGANGQSANGGAGGSSPGGGAGAATNTSGAGSSGSAPGGAGSGAHSVSQQIQSGPDVFRYFGAGGGGGAGGRVIKRYLVNELTPGTVLAVVVGATAAGGTAASPGVAGGAGARGQATFEWE